MNTNTLYHLSDEHLKQLVKNVSDFVSRCHDGECQNVHNAKDMCQSINDYIERESNNQNSRVAFLNLQKKKFRTEDISHNKPDSHAETIRYNRATAISLLIACRETFKLRYNLVHLTCEIDTPVDLSKFAGIWKGYIVRSEKLKIAEMSMLIQSNGKCSYLSDKTMHTPSIGFFNTASDEILHGEFKREGEYNFYYVLDIVETDILAGVLAGFGKFTSFKPASGLIYMNRIAPWQGTDGEMLEQFMDVGRELRSYNLKEDKERKLLTDKEPRILNFFFGKAEAAKNLHIETVKTWQDAYLVPKFELNAMELAGDYIIYRLGTSRKTLVKRVIRVFETGHLKMKFKRSEKDKEKYYGRLHIFEGHICIAIDRRKDNRTHPQDATNRTMYLFNAQNITRRKLVDHILGLSLILNGDKTIRVGEDILVKQDNCYDDVHSAVIEEKNITEVSEKAIFKYLQKGEVIKADKSLVKDGNVNLNRDAEMGTTYFESACFAARKGDKIRCVKQLRKAIDYGFSEKVIFKQEMDDINSLKYCQKEIEEVIDTAQLKIK
jgi:hypothetical protein